MPAKMAESPGFSRARSNASPTAPGSLTTAVVSTVDGCGFGPAEQPPRARNVKKTLVRARTLGLRYPVSVLFPAGPCLLGPYESRGPNRSRRSVALTTRLRPALHFG